MSSPLTFRFRTAQGHDYTIDANPASQFCDLAHELRAYDAKLPEELEFYYHGRLIPDSTSVTAIEIDPNSPNIIVKPKAVIQHAPRDRYRLPPRGDTLRNKPVPPDIDDRIDLLMDIGALSREDCLDALETSFFDVPCAARLLMKDLFEFEVREETPEPPVDISDIIREHQEVIDDLVLRTSREQLDVAQVLGSCDWDPEKALDILMEMD
jgi:hypothetical protein